MLRNTLPTSARRRHGLRRRGRARLHSDLVALCRTDDVDVVVAQRRSRVGNAPVLARSTSSTSVIFQLLTGRTISFGNFMALKPAALRRLVAMQELWIHVAAAYHLQVASPPVRSTAVRATPAAAR